jgi:hypothetical protein
MTECYKPTNGARLEYYLSLSCSRTNHDPVVDKFVCDKSVEQWSSIVIHTMNQTHTHTQRIGLIHSGPGGTNKHT